MATRCITTNNCCKKVSGKISLKRHDECCGTGPEGKDPYPYVLIGNAKDLSITPEIVKTFTTDYTTATRGESCIDFNINAVKLSFTSLCNSNPNLAKQLYAQLKTVPSATNMVFDGVIRAKGTEIPFRDANGDVITNVDPLSVLITSPSGLVNGVDYVITGNGISILSTAQNIGTIGVTGVALQGTLNHGAYSKMGMADDLGVAYSLLFQGVDKQGNYETFEVYKIYLEAAGLKTLIDGVSESSFSGSAVADECRTGTDQNKFASFAIT
jgi:hypothetical protein